MNRPTFSVSVPESPPIVAARTGLAKQLALLIAVLASGLFVVERGLGVPLDADSYLVLALAGAGLVAWLLLRRQHFAGVAWFLVGCLFAMAAASTYFYGSVRTVDTALILVGQMVVGVFLGRKALV